MFLPVMDAIRQFTGLGVVKRVLLSGSVTALCGSYFVYTSILAGK